MKKTALVLALISALLFSVVGAQFVGLAEANPRPWHPHVDPAKISILSPQNHTTYSSGDLNIIVQITKPETSSQTTFNSYSVSLFLDSILIDSTNEYIPRSKVEINTVVHYPFNGKHKLEVEASYSFIYRDFFATVWSVDSSSTVFFTVKNMPPPSPSPSPVATFTPEPTATPFEEVNVQSTGQYMVTGGTFAVTSIVVFLGLLFYFIKRR